jgi:hypothetical protein
MACCSDEIFSLLWAWFLVESLNRFSRWRENNSGSVVEYSLQDMADSEEANLSEGSFPCLPMSSQRGKLQHPTNESLIIGGPNHAIQIILSVVLESIC